MTSPFLYSRAEKFLLSTHNRNRTFFSRVFIRASRSIETSEQEGVSTERDFTTWRTADTGVESEDKAGEEDVVVDQDAAAEEQMEAVMSVMSSGILGFVRRRNVHTHTNKMVNARGPLSQRNSNKLAVTTMTSRSTLATLTRPRIHTS